MRALRRDLCNRRPFVPALRKTFGPLGRLGAELGSSIPSSESNSNFRLRIRRGSNSELGRERKLGAPNLIPTRSKATRLQIVRGPPTPKSACSHPMIDSIKFGRPPKLFTASKSRRAAPLTTILGGHCCLRRPARWMAAGGRAQTSSDSLNWAIIFPFDS